MKKSTAIMLAAGLLAAVVHPMVGHAQCAMCQASLANSENTGGMISAFRQGIGLLLGVMAVLGAAGWVLIRRARAEFAIRKSQSNEVSVANSCVPVEQSAGR